MTAVIYAVFAASVGAFVWALLSPAGLAHAGRVALYAGQVAPAPERPRAAMRLPRRWALWLGRAGLDWSAGRALAMLGLYAGLGAVLGSPFGLALPGLVLGAAALGLRVRVGQARRTQLLTSQLPEAIMLLASAIRSGLGFQQALKLVADQGAQPIGGEMQRFGNDLAMGLPIDEALARLQARFGSTDAEMLASALLVQHQTGGNLTEILHNLHATIRDRQHVVGQVRTLTAQGRLSGYILTGLPVAIALAFFLINRDYLMLLIDDPRGRLLLAGAIVSTAFGALAIRRIVDIRL
jgi:tight adherence protein B